MDEILNNISSRRLKGSSSTAAAGGAATGTAATTPAVTTPTASQYGDYTADTINKIYDAQKEQHLNQLSSAYEQNLAAANASKDKIAGTYQNAMNMLGNEYERTRKNTNEQLLATGLNTGAGAQSALAQRSQYQRDYGNLGKSEAEANAAAELGIQNLTTQYNADQTAALANNDFERAKALLAQYKENYNQQLQLAQTFAALGDFSYYANIVGKEQAARLQRQWNMQNPELAFSNGNISLEQYSNLMAGLPMDGYGGYGGFGGYGGYGGGVDDSVWWNLDGGDVNSTERQAVLNYLVSPTVYKGADGSLLNQQNDFIKYH